ncbi:MAG: hypothetical protein JW751_26515 [Polyangiaceae bacterium]|nr:hypothetical protein [Polyangiaceae bacterium]
MSTPADPHAPQGATPDKPGSPNPSTASREAKRDEPVVWPRDLNAPTSPDPTWGSDPEALRHG